MLDYILSKLQANESSLIVAICTGFVYFAMSKEPVFQRLLSTVSGVISGVIFGQMFADALSDGNGVLWYVAGIALCGQFIPQLIQSVITSIKHTDVIEFVKRFFKK